jgi:hypothetical protein
MDVDSSSEPPRGDEIAAEVVATSGSATAKKALAMIVESHGFNAPDGVSRKNIARAFAGAGKVVYGKAFDAIKVLEGPDIIWSDLGSVEANLGRIVLYEVKSTNRTDVQSDFDKYFFSISTAELLVAQSLGNQFKFVFVHTATDPVVVRERTLQQVFQQTKSIYPGWSIRLGPSAPEDEDRVAY